MEYKHPHANYFICTSQVDCRKQSRNSIETLLKSQLEQSMSKSNWNESNLSVQYSRRLALTVKLGGTGSFLRQEGGDFICLSMLHCTEETLIVLVPFMGLKRFENI